MKRLMFPAICICICLLFSPLTAYSSSDRAVCVEGQAPGCDGICDSGKVLDDCGICDGKNSSIDECGVCGGNNDAKDDCGVCFGSNQDKDDCGVCFGNNESKGCDGACFSNASLDTCGVCGGPGPSGCDDSCGSSKEFDSCGVCGGSDDSCTPQRCEYYSGTVTNRRSDSLRRKYHGTRSFTSEDNNLTANEVEYLACVQQWIQEAEDYVRPDGRHHKVRYKTENGKKYVIQKKEKNGNNYDSMIRDYFYRLAEESSQVAEGSYNSSGNDSYTFVMDSNCNAIPKDQVSEDQICGSFTISAVTSPISLIWEEGNLSTTMTSFPLNPTEQDVHYVWKASSKRPLLVYDPEHNGSITSASQLFGNWTFFKGTPTASLSDTLSVTAPWENGYEALGTLDANADGVISEGELTPLALWFDNNQNGVSDEGEVVSLIKKGVTSIHYKNFRPIPGTKDLLLNDGYTRVLDGKTLHGDTIDWFVEGSTSRSALILSQTLGKKGVMTESSELTDVARTGEPTAEEKLSGLWKWKLHDDIPGMYEKHQLSGILSFSIDEAKSTLSGHSFSEASLSGNKKKGVKSFLDVALLKDIHLSMDSLTFLTSTRGGTTKSKAFFDSPHRLKGTSTVQLEHGETLSYSWIAEKATE